MTARAAALYARRHGARDVTVAVPCASATAARRLGETVERVISLVVDEEFESLLPGHGEERCRPADSARTGSRARDTDRPPRDRVPRARRRSAASPRSSVRHSGRARDSLPGTPRTRGRRSCARRQRRA
jgi:hypothetical protein